MEGSNSLDLKGFQICSQGHLNIAKWLCCLYTPNSNPTPHRPDKTMTARLNGSKLQRGVEWVDHGRPEPAICE